MTGTKFLTLNQSILIFRFIQRTFKRTLRNPFEQMYQLNQQLKVQILSSELGVPMNLNFFAFAYKVCTLFYEIFTLNFQLKAVTGNCFSREVFIQGLIPLLDNTEKLVHALNELDDFANKNIEKIFLFAFYLFKDNEHQKLISFPGMQRQHLYRFFSRINVDRSC